MTEILGKPMIQWVYEHCKQVGTFDDVIVATDDERIYRKVQEFEAHVLMTSKDCPSPTERLYTVSQIVDADFYVMVNGDEPTLSPNIIANCIPSGKIPDVYVRNLMTVFDNVSDVVDSTNIKVVTDANGICLYLSRSPIPYPKGAPVEKYKKFVGVTGFTKSALKFYHDTSIGELEKTEDVDELRFVENGKPVEFVEVKVKSLSVDSPKDIAVVETILSNSEKGKVYQ